MKYMTFNSSCSYAGVANMLEQNGVDTTDREIAIGMRLPYLFAYEDGVYMAGPMLQSAKWFNLYLNKIGYHITETLIPAPDVPTAVSQHNTAMLGMRISQNSKHAVVYIGMDNHKMIFLNNKWEHTDEPQQLILSEDELLKRLDEQVMIATVTQTQAIMPQFNRLLKDSCSVLEQLKHDVRTFCAGKQTHEAICVAMNTIFRSILLDGLTMLELIDNTALADKLRWVQGEFLSAVRSGRECTLSEEIKVDMLIDAIDEYIALIKTECLM